MYKLHHIALTVADIDASIKWYEDIFGFKLLHRYSKLNSEIAHIVLNDIRIELFNYAVATKPLPADRADLLTDLKTVGIKHFCLAVDNLEKTTEDLKSKGVMFATEIDTAGFGGKYVFLKDCNDILIELYQA